MASAGGPSVTAGLVGVVFSMADKNGSEKTLQTVLLSLKAFLNPALKPNITKSV